MKIAGGAGDTGVATSLLGRSPSGCPSNDDIGTSAVGATMLPVKAGGGVAGTDRGTSHPRNPRGPRRRSHPTRVRGIVVRLAGGRRVVSWPAPAGCGTTAVDAPCRAENSMIHRCRTSWTSIQGESAGVCGYATDGADSGPRTLPSRRIILWLSMVDGCQTPAEPIYK